LAFQPDLLSFLYFSIGEYRDESMNVVSWDVEMLEHEKKSYWLSMIDDILNLHVVFASITDVYPDVSTDWTAIS
jgi:hypothetical protein